MTLNIELFLSHMCLTRFRDDYDEISYILYQNTYIVKVIETNLYNHDQECLVTWFQRGHSATQGLRLVSQKLEFS